MLVQCGQAIKLTAVSPLQPNLASVAVPHPPHNSSVCSHTGMHPVWWGERGTQPDRKLARHAVRLAYKNQFKPVHSVVLTALSQWG